MKFFDQTFLKFILVGVVNTIVGSGIMFVLYNIFEINYWLSSASNYVTGSVLSFFLNKYFTFRSRQWSVFMIIAFAATIIVAYLLAYGAAKPLMGCLLKNNSQKFRENAALFTGMCVFTGLNYLGQRFFVFTESK